MTKMLTQKVATFKGMHYSIRNAIYLPKPIQKPHSPIRIGGLGKPKLMKVIAKHANGWNMMRESTIQGLKTGLIKLNQACGGIGRNPEELKISIIINCSKKNFKQKIKRLRRGKFRPSTA